MLSLERRSTLRDWTIPGNFFFVIWPIIRDTICCKSNTKGIETGIKWTIVLFLVVLIIILHLVLLNIFLFLVVLLTIVHDASYDSRIILHLVLLIILHWTVVLSLVVLLTIFHDANYDSRFCNNIVGKLWKVVIKTKSIVKNRYSK